MPDRSFVRRLLPMLERHAPRVSARVRDWLWRSDRRAEYDARSAQEQARFVDELDFSALPPIFGYWANRHLRPVFEELGYSHPEDFFAREIEREVARVGRPARVLSIGAGSCDTEVRIARLLLDRGIGDWHLTCLDLTPEMLERGRELAAAEGMAGHFSFVAADASEWQAPERYDVVMANQCLHHIFELERVFDHVAKLMADGGMFVTSDMIGRNGHQRWPEARELLDRYWQELPDKYRYNIPLRRQEKKFMDWDCSVVGFEGIRAQDILPLLVQRFDFEFFYAYGNVIDPFIDRAFGWHFNADAEWDRDFIDRVHAADEAAIDAGTIKPTHMIATLRHRSGIRPRIWRQRTPESCVRVPT